MAELLVRVIDKVNEDFYLNLKCTKRGDVIVACPDGWAWGKEEVRDPNYRIFQIPDMTLSEALALCSPEIDINPETPSRTLQRRMAKLDLDNASLPTAIKDFLADGSRRVAALTVPLAIAEVRALKVVKPTVADPAIFGNSPGVF